MEKLKQKWSAEETSCLLALWSSAEVQKKMDGAVRTKHIFDGLQGEMAAAAYNRTAEQVINKIKKLLKRLLGPQTQFGS